MYGLKILFTRISRPVAHKITILQKGVEIRDDTLVVWRQNHRLNERFPRALEVTRYKHLTEGIVVKTLGMIIANRLQVECSCCYMICALGLLSRVIRIDPPSLQHFIGHLGSSRVILDFIPVLFVCHRSKNCTAKKNKTIINTSIVHEVYHLGVDASCPIIIMQN
jgi:hypothetical protein